MTAYEIVDSFHDILRESEFTHNDLEAKSGVTATIFRAWFSRKTYPKMCTLYACLDQLGCAIVARKEGQEMNTAIPGEVGVVRAIMQAWYDSQMTLKELAHKSGVAPSTIGNWFYLGISPRLSSLVRVADAVGVTLEGKKV